MDHDAPNGEFPLLSSTLTPSINSMDPQVTDERPATSTLGKRAINGDGHVIKVQPLKRSEMQVSPPLHPYYTDLR